MNYLKFTQKLLVIVLLSLFTLSCEKDDMETSQGNLADPSLKGEAATCEKITDLMAGQHMDVGDVIVINDGEYIYVTYEILEPGWVMTETHLHIADELSGIPQTKKGNPKIGKFAYKNTHDMILKYTYAVPLTWDLGIEVFIAAHAVVEYDYMGVISNSLPGDAELRPEVNSHLSYFVSTIFEGDFLNGTYEGWCIDAGHGISPYPWNPNNYEVIVFSSYGDLSTLGNVDHPEHLDKVNWVLNQDFVDKQSQCCGAFTKFDVQRVIWELVDDYPPQYTGYWPRVSEILELAYEYGEGYVPECDENMLVVLEPTDNSQVTVVEVAVSALIEECSYGEETAWAAGLGFPGNSWAMYFMYTICE